MSLPAWIPAGRWQLSAPMMLAMLYMHLVALGALLLKLPFATPQPISWSDALFTATSAATVTGLGVLDPGTDFTLFGQIIILLLIQLGGLGLMTFAVLVLLLLGHRVGVTQRRFLQQELNHTRLADVLTLVRAIIRVVLLCELIGAALLATVFVPEFGWAEGLWQALFHAVSAFNNAGFALHPDSLRRWVGHPTINTVIPVLFIVGGIGYAVLVDLYHQRRWQRLALHSKLMLSGSLLLIVVGFVLFAALEWHNPATLGQLPLAERLQASWFQATAPRTVGFNTVDISALHDSTSMLMMGLMFIGGGTTSTAGGIKVTTFIVLVLATVAFFRRQEEVRVFNRRLGNDDTMKVLALMVVTVFTLVFALFLLLITHDGDFLDVTFEAVSALGNVGLSRGITSELNEMGRAVLMMLMFLGRVCPLALGFFLASRVRSRVRYPQGTVGLG